MENPLISERCHCNPFALMKFAVAFSLLAFAMGVTSNAYSQGDHAVGLPSQSSYSTSTTGIGTTSKSASAAAPSSTPYEGRTDESDDTLYRGKTSESENPMLRDEGPLHFKTRPKEKIHEVDSLKSLQTTTSDPKFQGSFATSGVSSIDKVAEKANEAREGGQPKYEGDPRFAKKHLTFDPQKNDEPKKAQADSSPSPTPSPTVSPAKNSSGAKQ